jgi:hypothetical protein
MFANDWSKLRKGREGVGLSRTSLSFLRFFQAHENTDEMSAHQAKIVASEKERLGDMFMLKSWGDLVKAN